MRLPIALPLAALATLASAQTTPSRVLLTWAGDPAREASVSWRTERAAEGATLQFALSSSDPRFTAQSKAVAASSRAISFGDGQRAYYHRAILRGLRPGTRYTYRVGSGRTWSEWFDFTTARADAAPFRFLYLGDAQNDIFSMWSRSIRTAVLAVPDARFILHAGDLVDMPVRDSDWAQWFAGGGWIHASFPTIATPGNHEYFRVGETRQLSTFWKPQFDYPNNGPAGLEDTVYFIDVQGVRVISLNTEEKQAEQAAWLERVLTNNPNRWTVVTFHRPVYSTAVGRDNPRMRELWQPVFERHNVDLVLQGHDHSYGRRAGKNGSTIYMVSVAGPKMYKLNPSNANAMTRVADYTMTYQVVNVSRDALRVESRILEGALYDGFEIRKDARGQKRIVEIRPEVPRRAESLGG